MKRAVTRKCSLTAKYMVIRNDCRGFNNLSRTTHLRFIFFYLIEQHSTFLLHKLQVLYMCTLCDSTNINTIIEFVPNWQVVKTPTIISKTPVRNLASFTS